jgi:uncharacterized protein DUF326
VSRTYDHDKENFEKTKPDYMDELSSRDMRSVDDKGYTGEALDEEEDEQWADENQSPIAGKMSGSMEELERIQGPEVTTSDEVRECLKDSIDCYKTCTETITRCLTMGGKHAEPEHLNLLMDCARICNTNADFMLRNSTYYPQTCGITADICDECADTCDRFDDDFMKECASICRRCAESCREMAR